MPIIFPTKASMITGTNPARSAKTIWLLFLPAIFLVITINIMIRLEHRGGGCGR